jgi:hypothetical protein
MAAPFHARTIEDSAVCGVLEQDLTLEYSAVLECEMKDIAVCRVRHRIEPDDRRLSGDIQQAVSHAAEIAMTTMETPDSTERLSLRHLLHAVDTHARSAPVTGCPLRRVTPTKSARNKIGQPIFQRGRGTVTITSWPAPTVQVPSTIRRHRNSRHP